MKNFNLITKKLKQHLSNSKKIRVYDKDLACALGITPTNFATLKRRKSIPYEQIIKFCHNEKICCSEVFFD